MLEFLFRDNFWLIVGVALIAATAISDSIVLWCEYPVRMLVRRLLRAFRPS